MSDSQLEQHFISFLGTLPGADAAHDLSHIRRVVANAKMLNRHEQADWRIVHPAAWLHDCVAVPKDSDQRQDASRLSAERATRFLAEINYPSELLDAIGHAITAHSFSANIKPRSLEARIVQDADRLDALGAIGIARCLLTGGQMNSRLYHPDDPFCESRTVDDRRQAVDHFFAKLFGLPETMQTAAGRAEAQQRAEFMRAYLDRLGVEIGRPFPPPGQEFRQAD